jgi:predicted component of type VI protein secretion system
MKTTVELSDDLFRKVKAEAALRGRKLKDLVEEGLRLVLNTPPGGGGKPRPSLHDLMKDACGVVDSGVPDLASNPKHLKGFGRAPRRDR